MGFFDREELRKTGGGPRLSCLSCGLYRGVLTPKMQPSGDGEEGILICGEAPGETEDEEGLQWRGKAGKVLQREFRSLGYSLFRDAWLTNAVNCRPPRNRDPSTHEIACCRKVINAPTVKRFEPRLILLLGGPAVESYISPMWGRGFLGGISRWRAWPIPYYDRDAWVFATYHPSYILRSDSEAVSMVWRNDLKQALSLIDEPFPAGQMTESPSSHPRSKFMMCSDGFCGETRADGLPLTTRRPASSLNQKDTRSLSYRLQRQPGPTHL